MDTFDRGRLPLGVDHNLRVLLERGFLDRRENVLLFGPPGTGKTHLVCALGRELIQQGRRVIFYSCSAPGAGVVASQAGGAPAEACEALIAV